MATIHQIRPSWYTHDDDTAWGRAKAAFRRDWLQTKHDFGSQQPNLNQGVGDTISQATGSKSIPPANVPNARRGDGDDDIYDEENEPAYRFGFAAYRHHGRSHDWDADTEEMLAPDYGDDAEWQRHRDAIRRGWYYAKNQGCDCGDV